LRSQPKAVRLRVEFRFSWAGMFQHAIASAAAQMVGDCRDRLCCVQARGPDRGWQAGVSTGNRPECHSEESQERPAGQGEGHDKEESGSFGKPLGPVPYGTRNTVVAGSAVRSALRSAPGPALGSALGSDRLSHRDVPSSPMRDITSHFLRNTREWLLLQIYERSSCVLVDFAVCKFFRRFKGKCPRHKYPNSNPCEWSKLLGVWQPP